MSATTNNADTKKNPEPTMTINVPSATMGLEHVINPLLMIACWGVVGIAYLCVPGSLVAAVLAVICAVMSLGSGLLPAVLCLGVAIGSVGLCVPCLVGAGALRSVLLKRPITVSRTGLLKASVVVLLAGCAIAGLATLAGGAASVAMPGFLRVALA